MKKLSIVIASTLLAVALLGCASKPVTQAPVAPTPVALAPIAPAPVASTPAKVEPVVAQPKPTAPAIAPSPLANRPGQTAKPKITPASIPQLITIQSFTYQPVSLTLKKGTSVKWVNKDGTPHTVTFDAFKSNSLNQGSFYEHTFTTPGTFSYYCQFHSGMKGTVIVTQ